MPIMTTPPTLTDAPNASDLNLATGQILFDHVTFGYGEADAVVRDLSLSIDAGERVALVGLSGAGKSTLVSLLMRLRDVDAGRVTVDGQNIRDVTQTSLRAQIGVVTQDVGLLHRSIRDNIRYGRPDATDAEVEAAAEAAQAMGFIRDLRDDKGRVGLDAFVGDRGVKLSGGQRQRVTIARALLKDAPILVLDEATSALDSEAEAAIQQNLDRLMAGKTTLAIAHRLSTIAAMDRIVVMDAGHIVEQGTHDALLAQDGLYARLWARQSGGFLVRQTETT
jgi:ABC-type multidrug transport system fused ATPase/permease subunit